MKLSPICWAAAFSAALPCRRALRRGPLAGDLEKPSKPFGVKSDRAFPTYGVENDWVQPSDPSGVKSDWEQPSQPSVLKAIGSSLPNPWWIMNISTFAQINNPRPASRSFVGLVKYCYAASNLLRRSCRNNIDLFIYLPRRLCFRSIFAILTPLPILEILAPGATSRPSIKNVYPFDPLMTHTPNLRFQHGETIEAGQSQSLRLKKSSALYYSSQHYIGCIAKTGGPCAQ
jgi:hypothetical protein